MTPFDFISRLFGSTEEEEQSQGLSGRDHVELDEAEPPTRSGTPPIVVLGLDFGTSSSKIVFREIMKKGRPARAIDFGMEDGSGYTRFSYPSTVAILRDRLFYGKDAEARASEADRVARSFKVQLLRSGRRLHSLLRPGEKPDFENPAFISSIYLAVVLAHSREVIGRVVRDSTLLYNMDTPVSALDNAGQCDVFYRVLTSAIDLSRRPEALRGDLGTVWMAWREAWSGQSASDESNNAFLIPESLALANGAGRLLSPDENIYKPGSCITG